MELNHWYTYILAILAITSVLNFARCSVAKRDDLVAECSPGAAAVGILILVYLCGGIR